ncbi:hypothetical protein Bca101_028621 [Brassica carinata]
MIELVRMMGDYEIEPKLSYLTTPFDFDQANPMVVVWVLLEWAEQDSYCCSIERQLRRGPAKTLATLQKQDGDDFKESVEGD